MVLDPRTDGFSDLRLVKAMDRLSAGGRLAYTSPQLYYATAGRSTVKPRLLSRLTRAPGPPRHVAPSVAYEQFQASFGRWRSAHGPVTGQLLDERALAADPLRRADDSTAPPAELTAHGFGRALVVDDGTVAAMLVSNNFHVDHRCPVLGEDGYPEAFRPHLLAVLNRTPNLVVGALHGATPEGLGMIHRLQQWFPDPATRLIEIGLRPAQVNRAKLYAQRDDRPGPDPAVLADSNLARLADWEREWLAWGLRTPLGSLSPTRLMKVVGGVFAHGARVDERTFATGSDVTTRRPADVDDPAGPVILWWDHGDDNPGGGDGDQLDGRFGPGDDGFDGADFDGDG